MEYDVVVGLEVHLELNTKTKMFSGAPYNFLDNPNEDVNEIDLAHPGTLPALNMEAVKKAILICFGLNMKIDKLIRFDRKNYYYTDIPKGYQITQQFYPIGKNGYIEILDKNGNNKKIRIERAHMEEDTAKQVHLSDLTLLDYNRAGVPLVEIVTFPDMESGDEAYQYLTKLKKIMLYLNVSDCKMQEGSLRCDVNISLKEKGSSIFGNKVEIKNINSISNVKSAIDYEIKRQKEILDKGKIVEQETRRFDDETNTTISMRKKEGAIDYKYYPEPNIPLIQIEENWINEIKENMPELPDTKYSRYKNTYNLSEKDTEILMDNMEYSTYFEEICKYSNKYQAIANMFLNELLGLFAKNEEPFSKDKIEANKIAELIEYISNGEISNKQAREILEIMFNENREIKEIIEEKGYKQISDKSVLLEIVKEVIKENEQSILDYKNGKDRAMGFMVGQIMKKSGGKVNLNIAKEILIEEINKI